jgi:transposase
MEAPTYVGLDIHRKSIVATAVDPLGRPVGEARLGPSTSELLEFLRTLPGPKRVAMEPCTIWEPLHDALTSAGAEVTLANPLRTRLIADATIKTDKVDSEALATLLRLQALPVVWVPPGEIRALRHTVRERVFYRQKLTAVMNHIYAQLIRRNILYPDQVLRTVRGRESIRHLEIPDVNRALDTVEHLRGQCKELDREIHRAFLASEEAQLLKTIPGVGELAAVALAAFICPIERFSNVGRLSSYVGLAPSTHQSGEFAYQGRLKWDSNELLQWLLIELSWTHRQRAPRGDVGRVGTRVSRRRGKGKGTVAAAHKLLKIIFAILKERRPYRPHAPERPAAMQEVQNPRRVAATQCVRGTALGSVAANRLLAH